MRGTIRPRRGNFAAAPACGIRGHGDPHPPLPFDVQPRRQGGAGGAADECARRQGRACRAERDATGWGEGATKKGVAVSSRRMRLTLSGTPPRRGTKGCAVMRASTRPHYNGSFDAVCAALSPTPRASADG